MDGWTNTIGHDGHKDTRTIDLGHMTAHLSGTVSLLELFRINEQ